MLDWMYNWFFDLGFLKALNLTQGDWTKIIGPIVLWMILYLAFVQFLRKVEKTGLWSFVVTAILLAVHYSDRLTSVNSSSLDTVQKNESVVKVTEAANLEWLIWVGVFFAGFLLAKILFKRSNLLSFVIACISAPLAWNYQDFILGNIFYVIGGLVLLALLFKLPGIFKGKMTRVQESASSPDQSVSQWQSPLLVTVVLLIFGGLTLAQGSITIWTLAKFLMLALVMVFVVRHHRVLSQARDWNPMGSEDSVHPIDERRKDDQEYMEKRTGAIELLKRQNEPYKSYIHKPSIWAWSLMSVFAIFALLIDVSLFVSFLTWLLLVVLVVGNWVRSKVMNSDKATEVEDAGTQDTEVESTEVKFNWIRKLTLALSPIVIIVMTWVLQNHVLMPNVGDLPLPWWTLGKMSHPWLEGMGLYLLILLEVASYLIGAYVKVPVQRRWVLSVQDKPIYARSVMIFTPDRASVDKSMLGLYSKVVRAALKSALKRFGIDAKDYFDNGPNLSWLSLMLYPWIEIKSSYYLLVEATFETEELPTKVLSQETQEALGLSLKAGTAGELSYYYRYYTLIGVDPVVGVTRLGTSDTEDPIQLVGTIIEGHIANRVRGLEFDSAMMYPFFEEIESTGAELVAKIVSEEDRRAATELAREPKEVTGLLIGLNTETIAMAGFVVVKFNIIDRNPNKVIADQINENTRLRYELDGAEFKRGKARIDAMAVGATLTLPLRMLAAQLEGKDPEADGYVPTLAALEKAREYLIAQQATDPKSLNRTIYSLPDLSSGVSGFLGGRLDPNKIGQE